MSVTNVLRAGSNNPEELRIAQADLATLSTSYPKHTIAIDEHRNVYELTADGWVEAEMNYAGRPAAIAINTKLTNALINNVSGGLMTIHAPAAMDGTSAKILVSPDGVTYGYLTDGYGADLTVTLAASKATVVPNVAEIAANKYIKIEMTSTQTAARTFKVTFKG